MLDIASPHCYNNNEKALISLVRKGLRSHGIVVAAVK